MQTYARGIEVYGGDAAQVCNAGGPRALDEVRIREGSLLWPRFPAPLGLRGMTMMRFLAVLNGLVYVLHLLQPTYVLALIMVPERILHGEIWRLVSYIFVPEVIFGGISPALQPIFLFIYLWFMVWVGDAELLSAWASRVSR